MEINIEEIAMIILQKELMIYKLQKTIDSQMKVIDQLLAEKENTNGMDRENN